MGPGSLDECLGCVYEGSDDIKVHLEYCTHCKRAYYSEEDRDMNEDRYTSVSWPVRFGKWEPVYDCNGCVWLNITEEQQEQLYREQRRSIDHICQYYNRRVVHRGPIQKHNPLYDARLYPCVECSKDGFSRYESRRL